MRRFLPFLIALTLVVAALPTGSAAPAQAQAADCRFVLGFLTLQQMIPDIVGECLDNESYDAQGNAIQHTLAHTGAEGLLEWRKSDNFTAFTDGFNTWVLGPFGLQQRLNSQRFFWEWNPDRLQILPTPTSGEQCHTAFLSLTAGQGNAGVGHEGLTWVFTNNTAVACTINGYVGVRMLNAVNEPLPTNVVRGGGVLFPDPGATTVVVPAGGSAQFGMEWTVIPSGNETCPQASSLLVTPPNEFASIIVPAPQGMAPCMGGQINVTAVQAGAL